MSTDYEGGEHKFTRDQQRKLNKYKTECLAQRDGDNKARYAKKGWQPFNHNKSNSSGKGDTSRPIDISPEEYGLRYELATGRITYEEFKNAMERLTHG